MPKHSSLIAHENHKDNLSDRRRENNRVIYILMAYHSLVTGAAVLLLHYWR